MNWRKVKRKNSMTVGSNTRRCFQWARLRASGANVCLTSTRSVVRSRCHASSFFFLLFSSIHIVCFLLFVLFCFIYNIYRSTYLREIIFPCTRHNERSFFLFQYLTNYLSLKLRTNENNKRQGALFWTERASTFSLRSDKVPSAFLQRCRDFQTRKLTI